jgi:GNAT superfamily N-acetyltransferase
VSDAARVELNPAIDDELTERLIDIWVDVGNAGGAVGVPIPTTREVVEPMLERAFARVRQGDDYLLVAYDGDEVAGFGFLDRGRGPLFRHWATIKRLQVRPDRQGRGIGAAMIRAIDRFAADLGLEQIHLTVRGGTGTERFYERLGYEIVAVIPQIIRVAPGDDRDELYLIRRL